MPADLITLAHFSVSSAISLPKFAGEPGSAVLPMLVKRAFSLGSTRPALISLFSLSITSAGVPLGAPMPHHVLASYDGIARGCCRFAGSIERLLSEEILQTDDLVAVVPSPAARAQ